MLPPEHKIRQDMIAHIREMAERLQTIRDMKQENLELDSAYIPVSYTHLNNAEKADYVANKTLRKVQKKVGFPDKIR